MNIHQTEHKIELKGNGSATEIGVVALFMAGFGGYLIFSMLPLEEGFTSADVFGLAFICLWTAMAIAMGVFAISSGHSTLRIDHDGVTFQSMLQKQALTWSEIADFGLSYCGQSRGEGNTYDFYFSTEPQQTKNECSKKLKGKMIKYTVQETDYSQIVNIVIPFCRNRTMVEPFIGVDKFHIL